MKRILITGGAGFLGSHLARCLLEDARVQLTVIDDLSTGSEGNLDRGHGNLRFIHSDICAFEFDLLQGHDLIYHLACPASPSAYMTTPLRTLDTCYVGTRNILNYAEKHRSKVVFTSTSEVYGDPLESPQSENYTGNVSTVTPRACYDEGKRVAETLCYEYHRRGVDVRVARLFNTYGPKMSPFDGRVVSNFINQALSGTPLTVFGDGSQTRSLCYVSDTVLGLIALMNQDFDSLTVLNIGNDCEMSVLDIATKIVAMIGCPLTIERKELPIADPMQRQPDIVRAKDLLGWSPRVQLEEGLQHTIDYFTDVRKLAARRVECNDGKKSISRPFPAIVG